MRAVDQLLLKAVGESNSDSVWPYVGALTALKLGADVNVQDPSGQTPLMMAVRQGRPDIVDLLLEDPNIDINYANQHENHEVGTALHIAIANNDIEIVRILLADPRLEINQFCDVQALPMLRGLIMDHNALTIAVKLGHVEIVKLLLANPRLDLNETNEQGHNTISILWNIKNISKDQIEIMRLLLADPRISIGYSNLLKNIARSNLTEIVEFVLADQRPDFIEQVTEFGHRALSVACTNGNIDLVKILLVDSRIDINAIDEFNYTPLGSAVIANETEGKIEIVKLLLADPRLEVNKNMDSGSGARTALIRAAGSNEIIAKLLLADPRIDLKEHQQGIHTLIAAAGAGNVELMRTLLNDPRIEDINKIDEYMYTALMAGASHGNLEVMQLLLADSRIGDINQANPEGKTAFSMAAAGAHLEAIKLLLSDSRINLEAHQQATLAMIEATRSYSPHPLELMQFFMSDSRFDINKPMQDGRTVLTEAAREGRFDIVKLLLLDKHISSEAINHVTADGETALTLTARSEFAGLIKEYVEIMKLLLSDSRTGDINHTTKDGHNAFTLAAQSGNFAIVELLAKDRRMIDINHPTNDGQTALILAAHCGPGYPNIVKLLLDDPRIGDINQTTKGGDTALTLAASECVAYSYEIMQLLLRNPGIDINHANKKGETALTLIPSSHGINETKLKAMRLLLSDPRIDLNAHEQAYRAATIAIGRGDSEISALLSGYDPFAVLNKKREEMLAPINELLQKMPDLAIEDLTHLNNYLCAITHQLMVNPARLGRHVYERLAITAWVQTRGKNLFEEACNVKDIINAPEIRLEIQNAIKADLEELTKKLNDRQANELPQSSDRKPRLG